MKYPLIISVIVAAFSAIGWVVSVVLSVLSAGKFSPLANFFGVLMIVSIPIGIIVGIIRRRNSR